MHIDKNKNLWQSQENTPATSRGRTNKEFLLMISFVNVELLYLAKAGPKPPEGSKGFRVTIGRVEGEEITLPGEEIPSYESMPGIIVMLLDSRSDVVAQEVANANGFTYLPIIDPPFTITTIVPGHPILAFWLKELPGSDMVLVYFENKKE